MIERWFRNITDKAIRRGVFTSVQSLIEAIQQYLDAHNADPKLFTWTKDADTILAKIAKCKEALGTLHQPLAEETIDRPEAANLSCSGRAWVVGSCKHGTWKASITLSD
jgi:hypothetical protein